MGQQPLLFRGYWELEGGVCAPLAFPGSGILRVGCGSRGRSCSDNPPPLKEELPRRDVLSPAFPSPLCPVRAHLLYPLRLSQGKKVQAGVAFHLGSGVRGAGDAVWHPEALTPPRNWGSGRPEFLPWAPQPASCRPVVYASEPQGPQLSRKREGQRIEAATS